jgi:hypothetical protein
MMRTAIAICLSVLALIIGALCLHYGAGSVSVTVARTFVAIFLVNKILGDWYNPIREKLGLEARPAAPLIENLENLALWCAAIAAVVVIVGH